MLDISNKSYAEEMDQNDPLASYRSQYFIPKHNGADSIYLCGNSLGLQHKSTSEYVQQELDDWAKLGVEGHFEAKHPWMPYHEFLTQQMANVVGAKSSEVVVMNSLTVNLHLLMVSFYQPTAKKYKIVVEQDAFPSDRYAVASQVKFHGFDPEEAIITWKSKPGKHTLAFDDLEEIFAQHGDEIALLFIGGVNYYTGQVFDLPRLTQLAHQHNAKAGFDLAHGAGNINFKLHHSGADFAAWCTYKYLNSGPGGLSGIFVHERHAENSSLNRFAGWWGHNKETRFQMRDDFDPLPGAEGWQLSNPPILPMAALRASLSVFEEVGMEALRLKSFKLTGYLMDLFRLQNNDRISIITPENETERGCQVSFMIKGSDKSLFKAIQSKGVIADWREPDVIRIAPVPLYNSFMDVFRFYEILIGEL